LHQQKGDTKNRFLNCDDWNWTRFLE
jgi:hypothetical protein